MKTFIITAFFALSALPAIAHSPLEVAQAVQTSNPNIACSEGYKEYVLADEETLVVLHFSDDNCADQVSAVSVYTLDMDVVDTDLDSPAPTKMTLYWDHPTDNDILFVEARFNGAVWFADAFSREDDGTQLVVQSENVTHMYDNWPNQDAVYHALLEHVLSLVSDP